MSSVGHDHSGGMGAEKLERKCSPTPCTGTLLELAWVVFSISIAVPRMWEALGQPNELIPFHTGSMCQVKAGPEIDSSQG